MSAVEPPRVSIVMPAYQHAAHIGETVRSVLGQSFAAWELLVVDDGSTDGTGDVVAGIGAERRDPRIRLWRAPHAGVAAARNTALHAARGEYVAFLDADDPWSPDRLAALVGALDADPDTGLVFTDRLEIDDAGRPLRLRVAPGRVTANGLLRGFPFAPSDCLVRRSWARRVAFPPGIVINEDRDYFFRLYLAGCAMRKVDAPLGRRRRYPGRTFHDLPGLLADRLRILDRALAHEDCPAPVRGRSGAYRRAIYRDLAWLAVEARDARLARRWLPAGVPPGRQSHGGTRDDLDRWLVWSALRHGGDPEPGLRWFYDRLPTRLHELRSTGDRVVRSALLRAGLREQLWGRDGRAGEYLDRAGTGAPVELVEGWVVGQLDRLDATTPRDRVAGDPAARARIAGALDALGPDGRALAERIRAPGVERGAGAGAGRRPGPARRAGLVALPPGGRGC